jgi:hypothetical protein
MIFFPSTGASQVRMARGGCHCDGASPPATDGFVLKHLYEYTCDEWSTSINKKLLDREVVQEDDYVVTV